MKKYTLSALCISLAGMLHAQGTAANPDFFQDLFIRIIVIVAGVVMLAAILVLYSLLINVIRKEENKLLDAQGIMPVAEVAREKKESMLSRFYRQWTQAVPVDREEDVLLHHDFDGIRELDNKLPPWWVAMFYITIIWSVGYLLYYHVAGGPGSYDEYVEEVRQGEEQAAAYLASQANQVDENNVTFVDDPNALANGQTIFVNNCAACHGVLGEGGVGPNLTDDYYVHGGSIKDIFKVIKYGVPEKGMIAWKAQIRPVDMQQVASYIMTLRGTNPPNPKEPEGELYQPVDATPSGEGTSSAL
jgi:cytochrome c oxidase cbb3-type subunit III